MRKNHTAEEQIINLFQRDGYRLQTPEDAIIGRTEITANFLIPSSDIEKRCFHWPWYTLGTCDKTFGEKQRLATTAPILHRVENIFVICYD